MYAAQFLSGRVALVTGGAGGIGSAVSEALASYGCQVVAADLPTRLGAMDTGGGIEHVALDVTDARDVQQCVEGVVKRHGRLDILSMWQELSRPVVRKPWPKLSGTASLISI